MNKIISYDNHFSATFLILTIAFCVCIILANLIEIKTIDIGCMTLTAGIAIFPVSYIINDCIVEIYGFAKARLAIWLGFASSLFAAMMLQLAIVLPGGAEWHAQEAMEMIYGNVPRIMAASFAAFLSGSMINAYVMSKMKQSMNGRHFSVRAIVSTLWGEGIDSVIFFPLAFGGILPWSTIMSLIITQTLLKTGYEIIILPITCFLVRSIKRHERCDVTDNISLSYKWWKINEF